MHQVDEAIAKVQALALDLRPSVLDDLGLVDALRRLLEQHAQRTGNRVAFSARPPDARLPPDVETACFRIAQEALTDVALHARARTVAVTLEQDEGGVTFSIRDDGVGFEVDELRSRAVAHGHLGLVGMEERARLCYASAAQEDLLEDLVHGEQRFVLDALAGADDRRRPRERDQIATSQVRACRVGGSAAMPRGVLTSREEERVGAGEVARPARESFGSSHLRYAIADSCSRLPEHLRRARSSRSRCKETWP